MAGCDVPKGAPVHAALWPGHIEDLDVFLLQDARYWVA
jgi:hypothetical protein